MLEQNLMQILNEFKTIINKSTKMYKDKRREIQILRFLRGLANLAYVHASKLTEVEDSANLASKDSRTLTIDFTCVNQPLN